MLYCCDGAWWRYHGGVPEFSGLKLTNDASVCVNYPDVFQIAIEKDKHFILNDEVCVIGDGANSLFQSANLAVQFGAARIALVGADLRRDHGVHWHGVHPHFLNNPSAQNLERWRRILDGNAQRFKELGVEVINCSPISALTAYPVMDLPMCLQLPVRTASIHHRR